MDFGRMATMHEEGIFLLLAGVYSLFSLEMAQVCIAKD